MKRSPSKLLLGLALLGLMAVLGFSSWLLPQNTGFQFQKQHLPYRHANHSGGRYDIYHALPGSKKLTVDLTDSPVPDSVFLAPDDTGISLSGVQGVSRADFYSVVDKKKGRLLLEVACTKKFTDISAKGYNLRIGLKGLRELEIAGTFIFAPARPLIISEAPIRKTDFSIAFPKFYCLNVEVDIANVLAVKETAGLGGLNVFGIRNPLHSQVSGKTKLLDAQSITTTWDFSRLNASQIMLSADHYAEITLGSPRMLTLLHVEDTQAGGQFQSRGKVTYRGNPAIRQRYNRGNQQLELVGVP